jgi:PPM family protein phosphatase
VVVARRLTHDHTWVQEQVDAGRLSEAEARAHPYRGVVTRALGRGAIAEPAVGEWAVTPGDALLLCSDGVSDLVPDDEVADILTGAPDAARGARALVDWALAAGGDDNLTAVVVRILGPW